MANRDWPTAIQLLEPLMSELDGHAPVEAHRMLGVSLHELGELDAAEKVYERARGQYPNVIRLDVQWAQVAMVRADWPEAIRRLESIVASYDEDEIPHEVYERLAKAYRRLAGEHQERREFDLAEAIIQDVRPRFPGHIGLAVQWAQIAVVRGDWEEATRRLEEILATHERNAPPEVYRRLARSYQELGDFHTAAAVVARGRARHPDDVQLMMRWADVASTQGNLNEAIRRLEIAIANAGEDSAALYVELANAYRRLGDIEKAIRVINSARAVLEPDVGIEMFRAVLAKREQNTDEAISIYSSIVDQFPVEEVPPAVYSNLAGLYRASGDIAAAAEVIQKGRRRLPEDLTMAIEWAQVAMILEEWPEAIVRWEEARVMANRLGSLFVLPEQGSDLMWHEASWISLARHWPADTSSLRVEPSVSLYVLVARLLERLGEAVIASRLLEIAATVYEGDRSLAVAVLLNELELAKPGPGAPSDLSAVAGQLPQARSWIDFDEIARSLNTEALENFAPVAAEEGLPELRRIRIPVGSSLELAVRAGRFFNRPAIDRKIQEVSEAESWPELSTGSRPLLARARELADEYAERFEEPPLLPADVLSDAVFFLIYSELCVYEPMRRLARVIASEAGDDPVFIEISGDDIEYLTVINPTEMGQIYLYAELRRRGVNAFLCEFVDRAHHVSTEVDPISFRPHPSLLRARPTTRSADGDRHAVAVIPAGIRTIGSVLERLADPLVYSSGFISQKFAYDRTFFALLELTASIHPPPAMRAFFKVGLWSAGSISSTDLLAGGGDSTIEVPIEISAPLGMDWLEWLGWAVQQQLVEMAKNSHVEVLARGIKEAHISDHLYPESALFAGAVKAGGGRVTLWPHSANPVHEDVRRTGSFDVVYAVTRTGCEVWRAAFPEASVVHWSGQMLPPPRTRELHPSLPLSVVILGGKNVLGQMPFVDQTARDRSYVRFFEGLERLRNEGLIRVFYKPKGTKGETEAWLERIVGRRASWEPVFLHPARLDLPNMIFVSISVGSSGLLEGMGRGVPGLLVQDHDSADYTTLSSDGIPIGTSQQILEVIEHCAQPGGLEELIQRQIEYYVGETSYGADEFEESRPR